mmetsp:Transcript_38091/g.49156  ORF Transcript_38091/g.49156 Transcript_38091/m.49156 type:complete len:670 (-) Transcript_38091:272-2281(-)
MGAAASVDEVSPEVSGPTPSKKGAYLRALSYKLKIARTLTPTKEKSIEAPKKYSLDNQNQQRELEVQPDGMRSDGSQVQQVPAYMRQTTSSQGKKNSKTSSRSSSVTPKRSFARSNSKPTQHPNSIKDADKKQNLAQTTPVQSAPVCLICNMTFSNVSRLQNHVNYSSLHEKLAEKVVNVEASRRLTIQPLNEEANKWHLLFQGHKLFWRTQHNYDIFIWVDKSSNAVMVYAYDPQSEIPQSEMAGDKIILKLDEIHRVINIDSIRQAVKEYVMTLPSHMRQVLDEEKRTEDKVSSTLVKYVLEHLELAPKSDGHSVVWKAGPTGDEGIWTDAPNFPMPEIKEKRTNKLGTLTKAIEKFEHSRDAVDEHTQQVAELQKKTNLTLDEITKFQMKLSKTCQSESYKDTVQRRLLSQRIVELEAKIQMLEKQSSRKKSKIDTAVDKTREQLDREMEEALGILDNIKKSDIANAKAFNKPPQLLNDILVLTLLMMGKEDTSWSSARAVMGGSLQSSFLNLVREINLDSLKVKTMRKVKDFVTIHPECFDANQLKKVNKLAEALGAVLSSKFENYLGSKHEVKKIIEDLDIDIQRMRRDLNSALAESEQLKSSTLSARRRSIALLPREENSVLPVKSLKNVVTGMMFLMRLDSYDEHAKKSVNSSFQPRRKSMW